MYNYLYVKNAKKDVRAAKRTEFCKQHFNFTVCDPGYFGKDCKQPCNRTCSSSGRAICNHVNGTCLNGCFAGYTGTYCEFGIKYINFLLFRQLSLKSMYYNFMTF